MWWLKGCDISLDWPKISTLIYLLCHVYHSYIQNYILYKPFSVLKNVVHMMDMQGFRLC